MAARFIDSRQARETKKKRESVAEHHDMYNSVHSSVARDLLEYSQWTDIDAFIGVDAELSA